MSKSRRPPRARLRVVNGEVKKMPPKCPRTGKENYLDRIQADLALLHIRRHIRRAEKEPIRSYRCNLCGWYHHTSEEPRDEIAHSA